MSLSHDQKKYIKKHLRSYSLEEIAAHVHLTYEELYRYVSVRWPEKLTKRHSSTSSFTLSIPDDMRAWLRKNVVLMVSLVLLVGITYVWSLPNELVSDDLAFTIHQSDIKSWSYPIQQPFMMMRSLVYTVTMNIGGLVPWAFRLGNILFHAGSTLLLFIVLAWWLGSLAAFGRCRFVCRTSPAFRISSMDIGWRVPTIRFFYPVVVFAVFTC